MDEQGNRTGPAHQPGVPTGEGADQANISGDSGKHAAGTDGGDRTAGQTDARSATSVNPDAENPINPASPNMPPP